MIGLFIAKNGYSSNAILEFEASNQPIIYETHIPTNLKEILTRSEPIKTQLRQTIVNEGGIYRDVPCALCSALCDAHNAHNAHNAKSL